MRITTAFEAIPVVRRGNLPKGLAAMDPITTKSLDAITKYPECPGAVQADGHRGDQSNVHWEQHSRGPRVQKV